MGSRQESVLVLDDELRSRFPLPFQGLYKRYFQSLISTRSKWVNTSTCRKGLKNERMKSKDPHL